jgi:transcriptional regulator GlxA family with amidase domain
MLRAPLRHIERRAVWCTIHTESGADHNVDNLADQADMSGTALANHFKQKTGLRPGGYVTQWRIQKATKLLRAGQASITCIADTVGYQPEGDFRKAYRARNGNPPSKVRREG